MHSFAQILNKQHCSYKVKTHAETFCRNKYNVTGLCNRSSCPLANSLYATVKEHDGVCYLYKKTIERSHTPSDMWEKIRLKKDYNEALKQIDHHLKFYPQFLIHKNKQRLTKIKQYLVRMKKLAKRSQSRLVSMPRKQEKREARREEKAEVAARMEKTIESELLERLRQGTYNDIYNFPTRQYEQALQKVAGHKEEEPEGEAEVEGEDEDEEDDDEEEEMEYVEDLEGEDDEGDSDVEEAGAGAPAGAKRGRKHVEVEYEDAGRQRIKAKK